MPNIIFCIRLGCHPTLFFSLFVVPDLFLESYPLPSFMGELSTSTCSAFAIFLVGLFLFKPSLAVFQVRQSWFPKSDSVYLSDRLSFFKTLLMPSLPILAPTRLCYRLPVTLRLFSSREGPMPDHFFFRLIVAGSHIFPPHDLIRVLRSDEFPFYFSLSIATFLFASELLKRPAGSPSER